MVRPYALKGRKRKKREENYDKEDIEQIGEEETLDTTRKDETVNIPAEEKEAENPPELAGIPIQPYDQKTQSGAIFILEKASLEVAKVGKVCIIFYFYCSISICFLN